MPRAPRTDVAGYCYHVLNRANARYRMFRRDDDFKAFERVLAEAVARSDGSISLLGYVVMSNHWHLYHGGLTPCKENCPDVRCLHATETSLQRDRLQPHHALSRDLQVCASIALTCFAVHQRHHVRGASGGGSDQRRKQFMLSVMQVLDAATCIELAAFALMDNHVHLLLRVLPKEARRWSARDVARRWLLLHPPRNGYGRIRDVSDDDIQHLADDGEWVEATRAKLSSISFYMKEFKQRAAEYINRDEGETAGSLWQGRYKVKPVLTDEQLVATMAYIDLNPFAANVCEHIEQGEFTSLEQRLHKPKQDVWRFGDDAAGRAAQATVGHALPRATTGDVDDLALPNRSTATRMQSTQTTSCQSQSGKRVAVPTSPIGGRRVRGRPALLSITIRSYLQLLDGVSRLIRSGKRTLSGSAANVLTRLGCTPDSVKDAMLRLAM